MSLKTENKRWVLCHRNEEIVSFWVRQLQLSQKFYSWLSGIFELRYSLDSPEEVELKTAADQLINCIIAAILPEVDLD